MFATLCSRFSCGNSATPMTAEADANPLPEDTPFEKMGPDDILPGGRSHRLLLLFSVFVIGACGLIYELVAGAVASYLLGDSVTQYSLVIGVFLAAMGLGSYLTQYVRRDLLVTFLRIQLAVGLIGGFSGLITFAAFAYTDEITPVVLGITGLIATMVGAWLLPLQNLG